MKSNDLIQGSAVVCDTQGVVIQAIRDDLKLFDRLLPGQPFARILDAENVSKAELFIEAIQREHAVFDWEMNAAIESGICSLHFAGGINGNQMLILVAHTREGIARLYDEMMKINNEQMNNLRVVAKELAEKQRESIERDSQFYEELTRLNNELATLQRELVKKNIELEKLDKLKNQFLGMAAHDLRSPLGVILSYTEFLECEAGLSFSQEHLEFLKIIKNTSNFLLGMIDDLLDISAIESGKLNLNFQPVDIIALIEKNVALNRILAGKKKIKLEFTPKCRGLEITLDSGKIEQVLNNLISNAIKFSFPETIITIGLAPVIDEIIVSVVDQGQGIAPQELSRLFVPFLKTSTKSTSGEHSTGLGLSIVRNIVNGHGGRVWVESDHGKGTTFYFSLPCKQNNSII